VTLQHRKYQWFLRPAVENYAEGMILYTRREQRPVINFPKHHYNNGVEKNGALATNGCYKPTVRLFKNARTYLVDHGRLADSLVPSYFLECLLYNVPDSVLGRTYQQTYFRVVWWLNHADLSRFVCQNGQVPCLAPCRSKGRMPLPESITLGARHPVAAMVTCYALLRHRLP
jgi:hypothetical protein